MTTVPVDARAIDVPAPDTNQRRAATVIGTLYLTLMATGAFAQIYVPGSLPGTTAAWSDANTGLLRIGAAVETLTFAGDAVLAVAYYVLLRPVGPALAMLGAFWRLAQVAILTAYTLVTIVVLQLVGGGEEVRALTAEQTAALAWVATSAHDVGYAIGFVFMGLGSAVFAFLLLRSGYVPRSLALLGVVASSILAAGSLATVAFPAVTPVVNPALFVPMFVFEVGTGLWLLIRGIR